jgi:geranylgeranyl pyrophosphate synthase
MAVEFTHAATLVHDDVIDRSATRRGRPTVAARLGAEPAIVIGDF